MSDTSQTDSAASEPLRFDKAEYVGDEGPAQCAGCNAAIEDTYFEINTKMCCAACRDLVLSGRSDGSGARRFLRALAWGGAGAVAGAAVWMTITKITGWEIGLVAIAVGLLVGLGVRKGADGRGGWVYQSLAVFLTYTAIVATYVPEIAQSIIESSGSTETASVAGEPSLETGEGGGFGDAAQGDDLARHDDASEFGDETQNADSTTAVTFELEPTEVPAFVALPLFVGVVLAIAYAAPFLMGAENIIGILIIGFALFEAWKLNKRTKLEITGPFQRTRASVAGSPARSAVEV